MIKLSRSQARLLDSPPPCIRIYDSQTEESCYSQTHTYKKTLSLTHTPPGKSDETLPDKRIYVSAVKNMHHATQTQTQTETETETETERIIDRDRDETISGQMIALTVDSL